MAESGCGRRGSRAVRQGSHVEGATGYPLAGVQVIDIPCGWVPRPDQRPLWDYLERGGKRAVCVAHRRWGKDEVAFNFTSRAALRRPGNYWHMLPEYAQARKVAWDARNPQTGKRRIDEAFPREIRRKIHEQEMFIEFANGSTWQLVGSDRYNSLVGSSPVGIVFSEYAVADPMAWAYLRPILAANEGWALFIYTPRGANHGKTMLDFARVEDGWFAQVIDAGHSPVFSSATLAQERRQLIAEFGETEGEMLFLQEYMCSFEGMVRGAYYAKQLRLARSETRITSVPHAAGHEVYTFWDLGVDDSTSIWFMQAIGHELRFIDYYEASGEGLAHYAKVLKERPYVYGDHYMPHDADVRELGTGTSRKATAENLGIRPVVVVQRARDTQAVLSGIEAGRNIMSQCWFDEKKCSRGLSALEGYQAEYDEGNKKLADHPLHNWCSHGCLIGDTFVETDHGPTRIADIHIGDKVWTPNGYARVNAGGPTKIASMLVEITTASGQITCTPEHKFLTNMGLIEASEIKEGTRLFKGDEWQCRLISLFSRGINTGYRAIITGDTYGAAQDRRTSIGPYGSIISVLFQTGMRFITKMLTPLTTIFQTSNVAPFPFINASTPCSVTGTAFYVRPPTNAAPRPQNGTEPKKDVTGIPSMEKKHGNIANLMKRFANCAAKNISRLGLRAPNGAALIVNQKRDINRQETVYDLTVEREHCYVANGMLVSNSDAFRTFACGFRPKAKSVPVTSILDEYNYGGRW